jgi:hypothetical protein
MRRRMKMESVPVRIHDLGSLEGCCLDFGREELWERLDAPWPPSPSAFPSTW